MKDLNRQGTDARNSADYKEAINLHFRALNLAETAEDTLGQIYALNNIGTDLRRTYSNIEASTYHYLALELSDDNDKYLKMRAMAMNGLGNIFLALNRNKQAEKYFQQALSIERELNNTLGQAINYANLAETYHINNDLDSALYYYNASLKHNNIIDSDIGKAICKRAMGLIYYKIGDENRALRLLEEAFALMEDSKDAFHKLEVQISLAETYINIGKTAISEIHVKEVLSQAKALNSFDYQHRGYELLAKLKEKQELFHTAFEAKEMAVVYRDSVLAQNNEVRILELENRYKSREADQKIHLLTTENTLTEKNKKTQQNIFFLLIFLLTLLIGFLYYRYNSKLKTAKELEKINEIKTKFFSNISHEFRTPLTLIKAPLEKWLEKDLPVDFDKDARVMLRNSERLLFLVDQLLSLSKVDSGSFKINPQYADLSVALRGIGNYFLHIVKEKSIDYKIAIDASGKDWVDLHIIEIIVSNFLSNALKFTPENGSISIIGEKHKDAYTVKVANSGERLPFEELAQIFDRFYTKGSTHSGSTGIGLSLVKELCLLYDAKLSVEYNKDNEIEFTVVFPSLPQGELHEVDDLAFENLKIDRFQAIREGSVKLDSTTRETDRVDDVLLSNKPLLLVVEDNNDLRNYILDAFKGIYNTIEAKDGEEGIAAALEHIPDIIITDIMMAKVDGLELCNTLKLDAATNHIPIVILTALNEERDLLAGLKNKADDYVTKPFGANILKQKVRNLVEVRSVMSQKYRKEFIIKPLDLLISGGEDSFARILKDVIENEITNSDFGVDEFCEVAAMSRSQLYRKLKATVDMSVSEFIRVHRVKLASELLKNKNLNVTDVCYSSGFTDTSYFSKSFKDVFKVPPTEYRKKLHADND
ncbi:MAG TPA: response regulator [Bacteroidales bacterium]|nr:response regulator [Bacteroidales bacterium]